MQFFMCMWHTFTRLQSQRWGLTADNSGEAGRISSLQHQLELLARNTN